MSMKEVKLMSTTLQLEKEKQEVTEFITILKTLSETEKQQVKGIMIGINLSKTCSKCN